MSKTAWITVIVIIVVVGGGLTWWYSSMSSAYMAPAATAGTTTTTAPSATPTLILGSNSEFPSYLAAANGMALYTYKSDTPGVSNCTGACATAWPPYIVSSTAQLTTEANITGAISTITRSDGTLQVTYNGMPLYFFAQDSSTGDVNGNGEGGFSVAMATSGTSGNGAAQTPPASAPTSDY